MRFVIITGLSGAGKSLVLKSIEDLGFYCIDNMPPSLVKKFIDICIQTQEIDKVAMVLDTRGGTSFSNLSEIVNDINSMEIDLQILFMEADKEVIVKRYKESRRKHPVDMSVRIEDAIDKEISLMKPMRNRATHIIDTSNLLPKQLRDQISKIYSCGLEFRGLMIDIISFGFKYGIPLDSDLVFDVRFLPNPFYLDNLKHLTGLNKEVSDYVKGSEQTQEFVKKLYDMLSYLMPYYIEEGKSRLVISIGCTGGKHRSVTIAEEIGGLLSNEKYSIVMTHRDISKVG